MKKSKIVLIVIAAILVVAIAACAIVVSSKSKQNDLVFEIAGEYVDEAGVSATVEMTEGQAIRLTYSDGSDPLEMKHVTKSTIYVVNSLLGKLSEGEESFMIFSVDGTDNDENNPTVAFQKSKTEAGDVVISLTNGDSEDHVFTMK